MQHGVMRWSALWRSDNLLSGQTTQLLFEDRLPALFCTRDEARRWILENYGYIRERPDLQAEPHGWKMPIPVRVTISALPLPPESAPESGA